MGWEECCLVPQVLVYRGSIIIASRRDIGGVAIDKIQDVDGCILENTAIYASLRTHKTCQRPEIHQGRRVSRETLTLRHIFKLLSRNNFELELNREARTRWAQTAVSPRQVPGRWGRVLIDVPIQYCTIRAQYVQKPQSSRRCSRI